MCHPIKQIKAKTLWIITSEEKKPKLKNIKKKKKRFHHAMRFYLD